MRRMVWVKAQSALPRAPLLSVSPASSADLVCRAFLEILLMRSSTTHGDRLLPGLGPPPWQFENPATPLRRNPPCQRSVPQRGVLRLILIITATATSLGVNSISSAPDAHGRFRFRRALRKPAIWTTAHGASI